MQTHIRFGDVLKSIPTHSKRYNPEHQSILDTIQADLLFPIWKDDALYGCLTIRNKDRTGGFSNSEIASIADLLQNASSQFSTFYVVQQIQDVYRRRGLQSMAHGLVTQVRPNSPTSNRHCTSFKIRPCCRMNAICCWRVSASLDLLQGLLQAVHNIQTPWTLYSHPILFQSTSRKWFQHTRISISRLIYTTESLPDIQASPEAILQVWPALIHNAKEAYSSTLDITPIGLCQHASRRGQPAVVVTLKTTVPAAG